MNKNISSNLTKKSILLYPELLPTVVEPSNLIELIKMGCTINDVEKRKISRISS